MKISIEKEVIVKEVNISMSYKDFISLLNNLSYFLGPHSNGPRYFLHDFFDALLTKKKEIP